MVNFAADPRWRDAIASIESAGSGDYSAVGPRNPTLGRALGRYQIMEANIAPWSREILGRALSPQEFMSNPQLQDAIFDGKFGQYVRQYGPEGAAQAWFGGPGGVGKSGRRDVFGTTVGGYGQKFLQSMGAGGTSPSAMMQTATDNPAQEVAPSFAGASFAPPAPDGGGLFDALAPVIAQVGASAVPPEPQPNVADLLSQLALQQMQQPAPAAQPRMPLMPNDPVARGAQPRYFI